MHDLSRTAPAFVEMAHRIVWATVATVDRRGRPRSRVLHPIWEWDGERLIGWVATAPTPLKRAHLARQPFVSATYWAPDQDTCTAECRASWAFDEDTRRWLWDRLAAAPPPLGYDPRIIPEWTDPMAPSFAALRLDPWRLSVMPGSMMLGGGGERLVWRDGATP